MERTVGDKYEVIDTNPDFPVFSIKWEAVSFVGDDGGTVSQAKHRFLIKKIFLVEIIQTFL